MFQTSTEADRTRRETLGRRDRKQTVAPGVSVYFLSFSGVCAEKAA